MIKEKEGLTRSVSETTVYKWQGYMIVNIKKEEKRISFLSPKTWTVAAGAQQQAQALGGWCRVRV